MRSSGGGWLVLALGAILTVPGIAAADTYTKATFSGEINPGNANVQPPFAGNGFNQSDPFSGSFVFDNALVPAPGSGFVNVFTTNFPDISGIPNADLFSINFDGLTFNAGDNRPSDLFSTGIQYNDGQFNGLEFVTDFVFQSSSYQFRIDGPTITVLPVDSLGNPTSLDSLIKATINTGDQNLTNEAPFTPIVAVNSGAPEPAAWALMLVGFFGLGAVLRGHRRRAIPLAV